MNYFHQIIAFVPIVMLTACGGDSKGSSPPPPVLAKDLTAPNVSFSPDVITLPEQVKEDIMLSASDNIGVYEGPTVECYSGLNFENGILTTPDVTVLTRAECTASASDLEGNVGRATLYVTIQPQQKSDEQKMGK